MESFRDLVDLASEKLGGAVVAANDEFFAEKENLTKPQKAVFIEGKYTDRGKWMDGWETRRRRAPGYDWAIVRLGAPGVVRGVVVDTAHFKGNFPEACSIEACSVPGHPDIERLTGPDTQWIEILPKSKLQGDSENVFSVDSAVRFTHLRLNIFPDGGVARLRVHGDVVPPARWMGKEGAEVDLASAENGGIVTLCNDMFFGSRHNLTMPGRAANMGDGWETKRSRKEAPDWAIVKLGAEGTISRIEVDTNHFKGNFPESCSIEGRAEPSSAPAAPVASMTRETAAADDGWVPILRRSKLLAHTRHVFEREILSHAPITHVRLRIFPDGGVSRLRLHGIVSRNGREQTGLRALNVMPPGELEAAFKACCGSAAWARQMTMEHPYQSLRGLKEAARRVWEHLPRKDWHEAFRAHPRIGEKKASDPSTGPVSLRWSEGEQAGIEGAGASSMTALADVNRAYEAKFGHVYIVCATGKGADEMVALARARLENDPEKELDIAAGEQLKITHLRLEKLVVG